MKKKIIFIIICIFSLISLVFGIYEIIIYNKENNGIILDQEVYQDNEEVSSLIKKYECTYESDKEILNSDLSSDSTNNTSTNIGNVKINIKSIFEFNYDGLDITNETTYKFTNIEEYNKYDIYKYDSDNFKIEENEETLTKKVNEKIDDVALNGKKYISEDDISGFIYTYEQLNYKCSEKA